MAESDVINSSCQQPVWSSAGSFYGSLTTYAALQAQLDEWAKFTLQDLIDLKSGTQITILPATVFQNGVLTLHYQLNGKTALTYGWARNYGMTAPGGTTSTWGATGKASLMIPGSGANQADAIVTYNSGYQAIMYNTLNTIGDTFVHVLPGWDFRLLTCTNSLGYLREGINRYLLDNNSSLALLEIIEAVAITTWLKSQYTKVAVLGISDAAYHAAITGIITSPTACVVASGLSLSSKMQGYGLAGDNTIPGIYSVFDEADFTVINGSATYYRFSKSTVGELPILIQENSTGYTAGVLNGANVTHATHSSGHIYDPGMGAWLVGVM